VPPGAPPPPSYGPYQAAGPVAATNLAGFWRRFVAYIIDAIIVGVVAGIIAAIVRASTSDLAGATVREGVIGLILGIIYFGYLWSRNGQTLGYMALGIKLIRSSGEAVSFGVAAARYILIYLSFALCLIPAVVSAFMIGLGAHKQGIHDAIVSTYVVRT
jgi:uncharacterized RDD family membrane protein YckC